MGFREDSRKDWGRNEAVASEQRTHEEINTGANLRAADALELMAKDRQELLNERDVFRRESRKYQNLWEAEKRSNAALRGVITKLKKLL